MTNDERQIRNLKLETVGAIHVHSRYSDGTASVEQILDAARRTGVDFLLLSDHDSTSARREGWAGFHPASDAGRGGVTLIVGAEITPQDGPHCLALGVEDCLGLARMPQDAYLDRVAREGGYIAVAHPLGKMRPELGIGQKAWTDWRHPAIQSIEIWNYMHNWIGRLQAWRLHEFHTFLRHPHDQISGPEPGVLRLWDRVAQRRRLSGIAGLDCHARRLPLVGTEMFPYEDMFRTIRTHVFLPAGRMATVPFVGDSPHFSERDYLEAIREARCFVANDYLADSTGTRFWAECDCGTRVEMGESHSCSGKATLHLSLPTIAEIHVIKNGTQAARVQDTVAQIPCDEKGVHRAEAWLDGRPWVFTNHVYLRAPGK